MRLLPYGDRAVLVEISEPDDVLPLQECLVAQDDLAVVAVVPGARTLLIEFDPKRATPAEIGELVQRCGGGPFARSVGGRLVEIHVTYDGPDLADVATEVGLPVEEVVRRHSAPEYIVQFCGFGPGFGYLTGLDPRLHVPRLPSPRTSVPAGAVAIAAEHTGIYPRSSPGGWRLIGRTDAVLFDLDRSPPALLTPGSRVRFVRA
jgi:KipI family sensor histidine kinase inhibitor